MKINVERRRGRGRPQMLTEWIDGIGWYKNSWCEWSMNDR